jgi:hypothetical protein
MISIEKIESIVSEINADIVKFNNGNKAAGVRVRKAMQDIKVLAQDIRIQVSNKEN